MRFGGKPAAAVVTMLRYSSEKGDRLADVRDRAVASVKADAYRFAKNIAPIIREIQSTGMASHRGIAR